MSDTTSPQDTGRAGLRQIPFGRRGLILTAMVLIGAGTALNWGWLSAIGAAPLILALAPCAAMCAAGMCMMDGSKSCTGDGEASTPPGTPGN